jgi:hypothetical protein
VQPTAVLTTSGNAVAGETLTIGTIVYTWTATPTYRCDVLIGNAATNSLDNLKAAINHAAGEGTLYATGTPAHPQVTATTKTATALTIQANGAGADANAIATLTNMTAATWAAAHMTGGVTQSDILTATAAGAGASVAVDDLTAEPYILRLTVLSLTAAKVARLSFPDSVNAFGASIPGPSLAFRGPITAPITQTIESTNYPGLRLHAGSAVMRCNLDFLDAAASISYSAEIEQPDA